MEGINIEGYRRGEKRVEERVEKIEKEIVNEVKIEEKVEEEIFSDGYKRDWLDDEGFNRDGIYIGGY